MTAALARGCGGCTRRWRASARSAARDGFRESFSLQLRTNSDAWLAQHDKNQGSETRFFSFEFRGLREERYTHPEPIAPRPSPPKRPALPPQPRRGGARERLDTDLMAYWGALREKGVSEKELLEKRPCSDSCSIGSSRSTQILNKHPILYKHPKY